MDKEVKATKDIYVCLDGVNLSLTKGQRIRVARKVYSVLKKKNAIKDMPKRGKSLRIVPEAVQGKSGKNEG